MNRKKMTHARALFAAALASTALLTVAVGCQQNKKPADDAAVDLKNPPPMLRAGLPTEAQQVGQESESPSYKAESDGRLYVYNRSENKLVNSFQMSKGQELIVSGQSGRVTLDGNEVAAAGIIPGRTYSLFFDTGSAGNSSSSNTDASNTFRITPANGQ